MLEGREIKFRIPHYNFNNEFVGFSYWGRLEERSFTGPSQRSSGMDTKLDEQYTNLNDVKGKEIYEHDKVKLKHFNPEVYIVRFIEGGFCFVAEGEDLNEAYPIDINMVYTSKGIGVEVIGNIHEI